ncbi:hypothetical protein CS022_21405 [Veronia nyctiphanis]|uniref:Uncharacterized protein n=1 Tax=Veronia nyctiphanis TaxID=1278244 RepID=A0A4Q0YKG2_9GAMM|nr:hypothetical protein [Veronia nyctiphanis]RXJ71222.1 hypothetical protein CS022_21405 [Veronia nyctiphanis]
MRHRELSKGPLDEKQLDQLASAILQHIFVIAASSCERVAEGEHTRISLSKGTIANMADTPPLSEANLHHVCLQLCRYQVFPAPTTPNNIDAVCLFSRVACQKDSLTFTLNNEVHRSMFSAPGISLRPKDSEPIRLSS